MKLPVSWLKEYVDIDIEAEDLADRLTMTGLEVESVESAVNFSGVVVGEVLEREKHPNADKLNVAKVNVGNDVLQIVCGAPNLNVGQKVAVAVPGAKLDDFHISSRELRGITSHGMICSEKELGLGEDHDGILVLDKKAKVGMDFIEYIVADKLLDIKIFANRPDLMGMIGLAREVSAALGKKFKEKKTTVKEELLEKTTDLIKVEVKNSTTCPRYMARVVRDVTIEESPDWLKKRLVASGVRPINNVVDISNYVMLELGQPLHFFDLNKIGIGQKLIVRNAEKNEELVTLDGVKRKLDIDNLVIADKKKPIALAGIMGGENSEVDESTKDILIEAAVFEKSSVRKTSRTLGLRSEAVSRFEKGLPFELPLHAVERAAELLIQLAQGKASKGVIDVKSQVFEPVTLKVDIEKINTFLGVDLTEKEVNKILGLLGFEVLENSVVVPWWRPDVLTETDLIEEIVRIWGYDRLPSTLPLSGNFTPLENSFNRVEKVRNIVSTLGYTEILTYSFIGKKELAMIGENVEDALKLQNPLVSEQEYLRTTILPHMLMALRDNQFNKEEIRLFEIAKVFKKAKRGILPIEERYLCLGLIGGKNWPFTYKEGRNYYELKGIIERLLSEFGLKAEGYNRMEEMPLEKGLAAEITVSGKKIGWVGEIDKKTLNDFDIKKLVGVLYVNLDLLLELSNTQKEFKAFSKFPSSDRDISVIMNQASEVGQYTQKLSRVSPLIKNVEIIDIYSGKPLSKGKKSVTFRLTIQSNDKTLVDKEIDTLINKCLELVQKLGGEIRGAKES